MSESEVTQSCPTLCDTMDCSQPDSSVCGDSPGKNTGNTSCHAPLQGIFPTQGSNPGLLHCRQVLNHLNHQWSPRILEWVAYPFSRRAFRPRNRTRVSCIAGGFFTSWATWEASYGFLYILFIFFSITVYHRILTIILWYTIRLCCLSTLCIIVCMVFLTSIIFFLYLIVQFSSVQLLSHVRLFATPWIAACQASLSITNPRSSLRLTSIESVMPSSHLILCRPLLLLPPIPPSIRVFSNELTLRMRWPKYWSFSFSIIPSKEIPGLISFSMDLLNLLAVQGTLKSLLNTTVQNHQFICAQFSL